MALAPKQVASARAFKDARGIGAEVKPGKSAFSAIGLASGVLRPLSQSMASSSFFSYRQ